MEFTIPITGVIHSLEVVEGLLLNPLGLLEPSYLDYSVAFEFLRYWIYRAEILIGFRL